MVRGESLVMIRPPSRCASRPRLLGTGGVGSGGGWEVLTVGIARRASPRPPAPGMGQAPRPRRRLPAGCFFL